MKIKYILFSFIILAVALGCANPPIAEMDSAREAVFRAENDADVVAFARSSLTRAQDALRLMQAEAEAKRYDAAKIHAAEAVAAAERAFAEAKIAASRIGDESAALVAGLRPEIDETGKNLAGARYAELVLDYDTLDREIRDAYLVTDQAELDQAAGRYVEAIDKARLVRAELFDINQQIAGAVVRKK